ncbi:MAG TPA: pyrimidine-nucleoside phosphorylase, partial [Actinobacteria bacterium]|nr:pyrimidine-nucleoside phosphorylase [Actinomycetota bacterium]
MRLNPDELITKKRDGGCYTRQELEYLVLEFTGGNIADKTMAEWLAAVFEHGLDLVETGYLTKAMAD